jgi:ATP-dependent DNA ligase
VCARDLEGIVAKWKAAQYRPDVTPSSWIKIKNPGYSQARDRAELFEREHVTSGQHRFGKLGHSVHNPGGMPSRMRSARPA